MKLILFSGTHPRHLYVNSKILKHFNECLIIVMDRKGLIPEIPKKLNKHDKNLFIKHFKNRRKVELKTFGNLRAEEVFSNHETIYVSGENLNTKKIANRIKKFKPNFCFIFGTKMILEPIFSILPKDKINLHLGLSPWYKGSATLFWPFFHLEPQFCGTTFHQITKEADAGEIIHQCVPKLSKGDKIHDVSAKCVIKAAIDLSKIIKHWNKSGNFNGKIQKISGRNWREKDFNPSHLRIIYDLFNDKIVDKYLYGYFNQKKPKIISCIKK